MRVVVTPYYKDIFPDENDILDGLLNGIPSKIILELLSMIDAELFSRDESEITQVKIFNFMLARQAPQRTLKILENAFSGRKEKLAKPQFFTRHYNFNFMHYV